MAIAFRSRPKGCIHQPDRGSQVCSHDDQKIPHKLGFKIWMKGKGDGYGNAAVETELKTIEAELIWRFSSETWR